ncbi:MAG TPA: YidC/Oxa1 family insertase periplasmic-domain containing protein [Candidatus Udaeobacter sp.]|jgi:YidC/Oxa1 family membrane protein insertase
MDRTAWIAVTLCVIGLVLWELYLAKQTPPRRAPVNVPAQAPAASTLTASPSAPPLATVPANALKPEEAAPSFSEKIETLRNSDVELHLTNRGGGIREAVLLKQVAEKGQRVVLNSAESMPIGAIIEQPSSPELPEFTSSSQPDSTVQFERTTPEQIVIRKKFFFQQSSEKKDNFVVEMDVDFENRGLQPFSYPEYFVSLGSAAPIHARDYPYFTRLVWCIRQDVGVFHGAKGIDVGWFGSSGGFLGLGQRAARAYYDEQVPGAEWAAVSSQFFTTLIAPITDNVADKVNAVWARRFDVERLPDQKLLGIDGALRMPGFQLRPGQPHGARFEIYAGPKLYHRLAQLPYNEAEVVDFGMFKIVCQLLLNFMNLLHSWLGNYAAAILALTTIIKLVLWPIQNRANRSMRQMSALSPKMQELREKYKDDPTRMNQEVMKLYKSYGINPVGGCLPMVIQIPIFFGLFKMLGQAVELRNAKFLWVRDLSQPDTVAHLPLLGLPVNIIPLCMAATQIWLMQMTPKTGDATQRRVMMFTPLIFLYICYNFAAALALYYTTQNLFSILQFYQNKRQPMPTLEKVAPAGKRKR